MSAAVENHQQIRMDLEQVRQLVNADLMATDQLIIHELQSDVPLIQTIAKNIIKSGGKRLRPLIEILTARACGYSGDTEHHELATIIEFIHTATLLHDDVIDQSTLRRGEPTANSVWGNQASVLSGDFLYSRAFQILARRNNVPIMTVLANTTNQISEGEVLQLINTQSPDITETTYRDIIKRKTGQLYSAAAEIGAMIATQDQQTRTHMAQYGMHLGVAFQIIDDLLDYTATAQELGKNIGDDLAEGKVTLPLIYALRNSNKQQAIILREAISEGGLDYVDAVLAIIRATQAIEYTQQCALEETKLAKACLTVLPDNHYRQALFTITDFVTQRHF